MSASWLTHRTQHTDTLLAMLEDGANAEALRACLDGWWVRRDGTTADTSQRWRVARHEFVQLMANLAATLANRQRETLENRLGDLRSHLASFVSGTSQSA